MDDSPDLLLDVGDLRQEALDCAIEFVVGLDDVVEDGSLHGVHVRRVVVVVFDELFFGAEVRVLLLDRTVPVMLHPVDLLGLFDSIIKCLDLSKLGSDLLLKLSE